MMCSRTACLALSLALGFAAITLLDAPAHADDEKRARELHDRGLKHYTLGEYDDAIEAYSEAYKLVPAPGILFNLAQAYRLNGDCARALQLYKSYLRQAPDGSDANLAEEHVAAMETCTARARTAPAGSPSGQGPPPRGSSLGDSGPSPTPSTGGSTLRLSGMVVAGAGVALIGTSVVFGLKARSASRELDDFYDNGGMWDEDHAQLEAEGKRNNALAIGLGAGGIAALTGGAVLYYIGKLRADRPEIAVLPGRGGASVVWSTAF
jgi:tetratricopeptide (TPR) repeat protein